MCDFGSDFGEHAYVCCLCLCALHSFGNSALSCQNEHISRDNPKRTKLPQPISQQMRTFFDNPHKNKKTIIQSCSQGHLSRQSPKQCKSKSQREHILRITKIPKPASQEVSTCFETVPRKRKITQSYSKGSRDGPKTQTYSCAG